MKLTWRNRLAYALLGVAILVYVASVPGYLEMLALTRDSEAAQPRPAAFELILSWLTGPLYLVGWAAVVEYLSRIASALERSAPRQH